MFRNTAFRHCFESPHDLVFA